VKALHLCAAGALFCITTAPAQPVPTRDEKAYGSLPLSVIEWLLLDHCTALDQALK
jgi:hypothetical protein